MPFDYGGGGSAIGIDAPAAAPATVLLPANPPTGLLRLVKAPAGTSPSNPITVDGNGKNIDGAATQQIATSRGALMLRYSGAEWLIV